MNIIEEYRFNNSREWIDEEGIIITEERTRKIINEACKLMDVHPFHRFFANFTLNRLLSLERDNKKNSHRLQDIPKKISDTALKAAILSDPEWLRVEKKREEHYEEDDISEEEICSLQKPHRLDSASLPGICEILLPGSFYVP